MSLEDRGSDGGCLDANVLVALVVAEHVHHDAAREGGLSETDSAFATCPDYAEAALFDSLLLGEWTKTRRCCPGTSSTRSRVLTATSSGPTVFLSLMYRLAGVVGHRQVTDAYLAQLARSRNGQLVTLDSGLAHLHHDVAILIST